MPAVPTGMLSPGKTVQIDAGLAGYYVRPLTKDIVPAVVVIMEAFGLNDYIKSVCDRLAQAGYAAIAPDFYHGATYAYTDINAAIAKLKSLKDETVMTEFGKAVAFLSKQGGVLPNGVGVMGFCMGGRYTFMANAIHASKVKAAVSFYGGGISAAPDPLGRADLLGLVPAMTAPLMLMYGAEDQSIAPEEHQRVALALSKAKKRYTLNVFPQAGHGFFSDRRDSYNAAASAEAWAMTMNFFRRHLKNDR
ncbi:MAG TPA: dienelactone hydrolase family protein [Stenomitos sp.]